MKKALIVASVASMIDQFNMPNIKLLLNLGYEVHVACNFEKGNTCDKETIEELKKDLKNIGVLFYQIDFARDITKIFQNFTAFKQVKKLLKNNEYKLIHCHSPIGGIVVRLAAFKARKRCGTKVIYTAHGFHFFKGGPIKNWILYYPVEWLFSFLTDVLITINKEDFTLAKNHMHAKKVFYIPGVGIDTEKFENINADRLKKRKEIGVLENDIAVVSVGELTDRKNHETVLRAIAKLKRDDIAYVICGIGEKEEILKNLARELGVKLIMLGYRCDIAEILKSCDIFAFPSKREGLGLAAVEGMSCGLPVVASNINGILDYLVDGVTGYGCPPNDIDSFAEKINLLCQDKNLRDSIGRNNIIAARKYDIKNILKEMRKIYDI